MEVEINDAELRGEREGAGHEQRWIRGEKKESRENYIKKEKKLKQEQQLLSREGCRPQRKTRNGAFVTN